MQFIILYHCTIVVKRVHLLGYYQVIIGLVSLAYANIRPLIVAVICWWGVHISSWLTCSVLPPPLSLIIDSQWRQVFSPNLCSRLANFISRHAKIASFLPFRTLVSRSRSRPPETQFIKISFKIYKPASLCGGREERWWQGKENNGSQRLTSWW